MITLVHFIGAMSLHYISVAFYVWKLWFLSELSSVWEIWIGFVC